MRKNLDIDFRTYVLIERFPVYPSPALEQVLGHGVLAIIELRVAAIKIWDCADRPLLSLICVGWYAHDERHPA